MCVIFVSENLFAYTKYEYTGECRFVSYSKEFQDCLDKEFIKYDRELNAVYQQLFKHYPNVGLRTVEEAWVKFKEADCAYMAREVDRGIFYPFILKACWTSKTKARIADLQRDYYHSGWFERKGW